MSVCNNVCGVYLCVVCVRGVLCVNLYVYVLCMSYDCGSCLWVCGCFVCVLRVYMCRFFIMVCRCLCVWFGFVCLWFMRVSFVYMCCVCVV